MKEKLKYIATDSRSLSELIKGGYLYVDKTMHLYKLFKDGSPSKYWFLSRPRRFGKSLAVDTLENIFLGNKELFHGLFIYDKYDFEAYPVIRINLNGVSTGSLDEFISTLKHDVMYLIAEDYGISENFPLDEDVPSRWMTYLITSLARKYGKQVVVLIDEYDYPLIDAVKEEAFDSIRKSLESFYSVLKAREKDIKFCFITGVTRFSQVSIFSKLNNLMDISSEAEYVEICGYTDAEFRYYFSAYIEQYFEEMKIPESEYEAFFTQIREYYDGYRFCGDSDVTLYNPVSIGRFISSGCRFENFWIATGAQNLVNSIIKAHPDFFAEGKRFEIGANSLSSFEVKGIIHNASDTSVYAYLLQAGYLTIKGVEGGRYVLGYPNLEVQDAMNEQILALYGLGVFSDDIGVLREAFQKEDTKAIIEKLKVLYTGFPYDMFLEKERGYHIAFHALMRALGFEEKAEEKTNRGRIDEVVVVNSSITFIIELKLDEDGSTALRQIEERRYYEKYLGKDNTVHLLGINFSSKDRNITDWKESVIKS